MNWQQKKPGQQRVISNIIIRHGANEEEMNEMICRPQGWFNVYFALQPTHIRKTLRKMTFSDILGMDVCVHLSFSLQSYISCLFLPASYTDP